MKKHFHLIILALLFFSSCFPQYEEPEYIEDKDGVVLKMPTLWSTRITNPPAEDNWTWVSYPAHTQNIVLTVAEEGGGYGAGKPVYYGLNTSNGKIVWKTDKIKVTSIGFGYSNGDKLIFFNRARLACLQLNTGELAFNHDIENGPGAFFLSGWDDKFYFSDFSKSHNKPYEVSSAWEGNIETGELKEIFIPEKNLPTDTTYGYYNVGLTVERILPYTSPEGKKYLLFFYSSSIIPQGITYLTLYDYDEQKIIYDIQLPNEYGLDGSPVIYKDRLYVAAAEELYCMDIFTQKIYWRHKTGFRYHAMRIEKDAMLIIRWGIGTEMIAYDIANGNKLWAQSIGSPELQIQVLNDIVYYTSNEIYAFELKTGKKYWQIQSPDLAIDDDANFFYHCVVVPGEDGQKGKIICNTQLGTHCYEAIR